MGWIMNLSVGRAWWWDTRDVAVQIVSTQWDDAWWGDSAFYSPKIAKKKGS